MKKISLLPLISIVMVSIFMVFLITSNNSSTLTDIDSDQLTNLLDEESELQYLYIGRPTCPICVEFQPILEEVIQEEEIDVYYYNTDVAREENSSILSEMMENLDVTSVPTLMAIENGTEVNRLVGESTKEEIQFFLNK